MPHRSSSALLRSVETLNRDERKTIIRVAKQELKGKFPIVAGVEAVSVPEVVALVMTPLMTLHDS